MSLVIFLWLLLVTFLAVFFLTVAVVCMVNDAIYKHHLEQLKLDADESLRNRSRDSRRNAYPNLYVEH